MLSALASEVEVTVARRDAPHVPVLLRETVAALRVAPGMTIVDATLGPGGHAEVLADAVGPSGRVIGIDRDPDAIELSRQRLRRVGDRFIALHGDHREIAALLQGATITVVDAVIADLGISSRQLDDPSRGFAFSADGPLDMRMDPGAGGTSAAELLATLDAKAIAGLLARWGEERQARKIAAAIARERERAPIETTRRLAEIVERAAGPQARRFRIHPATRTFQALRIAVNREIEGIPELVAGAASLLRPGGRIAVISFHSLEDRAVKQAMRDLANRCVCPPGLPVCACGREDVLRIVTARPIVPSDDEVRANPRARSAKLRVAERL